MSKSLGTKIAIAGAAMLAAQMVMPLMLVSAVSSTFMAAIPAAEQTVKASANRCTSSSDDDDGDVTSAVTSNDNATRIAQGFAAAGFSKEATAAALGNLEAESGFNPQAVNASSGATGIAQWLPASKISNWLNSNGHSDMDMLDLDAQLLFLIEATAKSSGSWNDYYLSNFESEGYSAAEGATGQRLYNTWKNSSDVKAAAVAWMDGFERPGHTSSEAQRRANYAQAWYDTGLNTVEFTGVASDETNGTPDACTPSDDGNAEVGAIGGAPTDTHTYDWMCDTVLHVCNPGDMGAPPLDWSGDYQCYWYWYARSYIVFNGDVYNPRTSWGGELANWASQQPDWTKSDSPRPGAGVSFILQSAGINHVAFVEEVQDDPTGWKILISEGNSVDNSAAGNWNEYNTRWLTKTQYEANGGQGFFWKNSWEGKMGN